MIWWAALGSLDGGGRSLNVQQPHGTRSPSGVHGDKAYAHVLWMGGSPCAGKTSIADLLAGRYALAVYHVDERVARYFAHVTREEQPCLFKWTHTPWNDLWLQSPATLLQEAIACYGEQFDMIRRDLHAMPGRERILVEGTSLLPDRVATVMAERDDGIWVVPTEPFQRQTYRTRGGWVDGILAECEDPERAYRNWMDRDVAYARWVGERARSLGLCVLTVSGRRTIEQNAEIVARHFGLA